MDETTPHEAATPAPAAEQKPMTEAERRKQAVLAYYEARTREEKAAVVEKYPLLREIFSAGNHS